jgi:hypothetical protein
MRMDFKCCFLQVVAILSVEGVKAIHIKQGAANADDFWAFICDSVDVFVTGLYDILVMDNASIHHKMEEQVQVGSL